MKNNETNDNQVKAQDETIQDYEKRIFAILVDDETERLNFLPHYLGNLCVHIENKIYDLMGYFCKDYSGDFWDYYKLVKIDCHQFEGFYMTPSEEKYQFVCNMNYFSGELSADAVGIIITLYALNWYIAEMYSEHGAVNEHLIRLYDALREFAAQHVERKLIFRAID